jgi:hypothetical protein
LNTHNTSHNRTTAGSAIHTPAVLLNEFVPAAFNDQLPFGVRVPDEATEAVVYVGLPLADVPVAVCVLERAAPLPQPVDKFPHVQVTGGVALAALPKDAPVGSDAKVFVRRHLPLRAFVGYTP